MFNHQWIETYDFEDIPLDRDIFLIEERWLPEYEAAMMAFLRKETKEFNVGEVAFAAARGLQGDSMQMSWYPNVFDRFHEVPIRLPRSAFVTAVGAWQIDEKPHVFVKDAWLNELYRRAYAVFVMIDAIGVKNAIFTDQLTTAKLIELQAGVDQLAAQHPDMAFVSFADSLLVKANWQPLAARGDDADYQPERLLRLLVDVQQLYRRVLGLDTYAVITQGSNEYGDLMHLSAGGNHFSLNSLGLPFAQITSIDDAARSAGRTGLHAYAEVYMDEHFFHSLKLDFKFDKKALPRGTYTAPLALGPAKYVMASRELLIANLDKA